jgi:hypothetical protein
MSGTMILPPIPTYQMVSANEGKYVAAFAASDPQTKAEAAYFQSVASTLTTPEALLQNYRALNTVLNAFGIGSYAQDTALLKQLMTQNPNDTTSTAYQIDNPALSRFAVAMGQFATPPFATSSNVAALLNANATNNFETQEDSLSPGIADALYFSRSIGSITAIDQLMSDPKLLQVAEVATNMPSSFGELDFDTQQRLLSAQIDIADFQKPAYVQQFVTKYLAMNEANNATPTDTTGALAILTGSGSTDNILSALMPASSSSSTDPLLALFSSDSSGSSSSSSSSILSLLA